MITIISLSLSAYLYLHFRKSKDFEPLIKKKLAEMVFNASKGLYHLELEKTEIDVTNASITVNKVVLSPDSSGMAALEKSKQLPDNIYTISLHQLYVKGLTPLDLLNGKQIDIKTIILDSPDIQIYHKKRNFGVSQKGNLYAGITKNNQSWKLGNLLLKNIHLRVTNADRQNKITTFKNLTASFTDILIDSSTKNDSTRFLYARQSVVLLKGYESISANKLYKFSIDSVALQPQEASLQVYKVRLQPFESKEKFNNKLLYSKDRYELYCKYMLVKHINWWALLEGEGIHCKEINATGGYIDVFKDRRPPSSKKNKIGNYPQQLLMKVNLPVEVQKMTIADVKVTYGELNPASGKPGYVELDKVNSIVENITNIPEVIAQSGQLRVNAVSRLMNEGELKARFVFNLKKAAGGLFTVDASIGSMDGTRLNTAAVGMGLLKIKSLQIDKLEIHIAGSNTEANGKVLFTYHDLSIEALKKEEDGGIKKQGLKSFIANNFIIRKSNPQKKGEKVTSKVVHFNRDVQKSFFNLIWKTMSQGVLQTAKGK